VGGRLVDQGSKYFRIVRLGSVGWGEEGQCEMSTGAAFRYGGPWGASHEGGGRGGQ